MKFDILEIQKIVEEKRLFYGQKLENFLLSFLKSYSGSLKNNLLDFFSTKKSILFSCVLIILASFLSRLNRDFGFDSFLVFNQLQLDSRAIAEIIIHLIGIASLLICYKILFSKKDEFITKNDLYLRHFLLASVCFSYFFRIYLTQFNEYLTFSTIFIALIWPMICFEIKKNRFSFLDLSLIFLALALLSKSNLNLENKNYFEIFQFEFFFCTLFCSISFSYIKNNNLLKSLIYLSFLSFIFSLFENNLEFRSLIFAFFMPAFFYIIFFLIKDKKLNLARNWWWILILISVPQFDFKSFISLFKYCSLIWLFFLAYDFYQNKKNKTIAFSFTQILSLALIASYFLSLILAMIFNHQNLYTSYLKFPNFISKQQTTYIQGLTPDQVLIISDKKSDFYFYPQNFQNQNKEKIIDKTTRIIFVRTYDYQQNQCKIGFLENYFSDKNLKKYFQKNYKFLNEIVEVENYSMARKLINQASESDEGNEEFSLIKNKIEVYVRK